MTAAEISICVTVASRMSIRGSRAGFDRMVARRASRVMSAVAAPQLAGCLEPVEDRGRLLGRYEIRHQLAPHRDRHPLPGLGHGDVPRGVLAQLADADALRATHARKVATSVAG
jgi:hypothetical protein